MMTGELRLRVEQQNDRMRFRESFVSGAFKLGKPLWREGIPLYYLLHVGGGYISGDYYKQQIHVAENAALYLTTQAATKVYKGSQAATVETQLLLKANSHLTLVQDPIILYDQATFHQKTVVELETGASFYYSEIITPGWSSTAEPFLYNEFYSDFQVMLCSRLVYVDRLFWQKGMQQTFLHLANYTHYGTYFCIDVLPNDFYEWLEQWAAIDCAIGVSRIEQGFVCKVVAHYTQAIEKAFLQLDDMLRATMKRPALYLRKY